MKNKLVALAYCIENIEKAEEIEKQLNQTSYGFNHIYGKKDANGASISQQVRNQDKPIILLISDNYLKSPKCMEEGLKMIQEKKNFILPVIIDGRTIGDKKASSIPTRFERVSDIIQYINYWQDQYLDLRRQKRTIQDLDEEKFNAHLKIMRAISSEVGEFLRTLRSLPFVSYETFKEDHYESFFGFLNDPQGWEAYKKLQPKEIAETVGTTAGDTFETEAVDLSNIPGYDLLQEKEESSESKILEEVAESSIGSSITEIVEETTEAVEAVEEEPLELSTIPAKTSMEEVLSEEADEEATGLIDELLNIEEVEEEEEEDLEEEVGEIEVPLEEDMDEMEEEIPETETVYDASNAIMHAYELVEADNSAEAVTFLKKEVEAHPNIADIKYHYALILVQKDNNIQEAQKQLENAVEIEPENEDALFLLGDLAALNGEYEDAVDYYKEVATFNPEYPNVYFRLGTIYSKHFEEKEKKTAKYFKKAIDQDPNNIEANYQYAVLLNESLEKPKKAGKYFNRVIELYAEHPFAHYDLAFIHQEAGEKEKAKEAYIKAISINPALQTEENDLIFQLIAPTNGVSEEEVVEAELPEESTGIVFETSLDTDETLDVPTDATKMEEEVPTAAVEEVKGTIPPKGEATPESIAVEAIPEEGKTIFIANAANELGKALAHLFAKNGYQLILGDVSELDALKQEIEETHQATTHIFPINDQASDIEKPFELLPATCKEIDILINISEDLPTTGQNHLDQWENTFDNNLRRLLYLTKAISPFMVEREGGDIINIGVHNTDNVNLLAKQGLASLTKATRLDLHQHNVRVSLVNTEQIDKQESGMHEDSGKLSVNDIAETIFFMVNCPAHLTIQDIHLVRS